MPTIVGGVYQEWLIHTTVSQLHCHVLRHSTRPSIMGSIVILILWRNIWPRIHPIAADPLVLIKCRKHLDDMLVTCVFVEFP